MELHEAEKLARAAMEEWLPLHWEFKWLNSRKVLGRCSPAETTIWLSRHHVAHGTREQVLDTIWHEVAHGMAGYDDERGHGPEWQRWAVRLGAKPSACSADVQVPGKYRAFCPRCKEPRYRHRYTKSMDAGQLACASCCKKHAGGRWDARFLLTGFERMW